MHVCQQLTAEMGVNDKIMHILQGVLSLILVLISLIKLYFLKKNWSYCVLILILCILSPFSPVTGSLC